MSEEHCIMCGDTIPEGRSVCPQCESKVYECIKNLEDRDLTPNNRNKNSSGFLYILRKKVLNSISAVFYKFFRREVCKNEGN